MEVRKPPTYKSLHNLTKLSMFCYFTCKISNRYSSRLCSLVFNAIQDLRQSRIRKQLQSEGAENTRGQRLQIIHVLRNEAYAVAIVQQAIIANSFSSKKVDCRISDLDPKFILSRSNERTDVN